MRVTPRSPDVRRITMRTRDTGPWVVYESVIKGEAGPRVVCEQAEWDAMERDHPGLRTLVRSGIATEAEAERWARGTSGDPIPRYIRVARLRAEQEATEHRAPAERK
jgi:hypothetical protein